MQSVMQSGEAMLNKWQRIRLVRQLGLNTEESILVEPGTSRKIPDYKFINSQELFSLRTFNNNDNSFHPHHPVISKKQLLRLAPKLLRDGFSLIIAKCVDPKLAELAGCGYKRGKSVTLEVKYGAVTVRKITHDGDIDKTVQTGLVCGISTGDKRLDAIIREIRLVPVDECIFEFSWYSAKVGQRRQNMIFWEVTGADEKGVIYTESGDVVSANNGRVVRFD